MILKRKLDSILLVDDDEAAIFLHKAIIEIIDCTNNIVIAENGEEAIKQLTEKIEGKYLQPSLILLDINMPRMNGWEFLEMYKRLSIHQKARIVIIMLTTSLNPSDREKAQNLSDVSGFMNKPITIDSLRELLMYHFPDYIEP